MIAGWEYVSVVGCIVRLRIGDKVEYSIQFYLSVLFRFRLMGIFPGAKIGFSRDGVTRDIEAFSKQISNHHTLPSCLLGSSGALSMRPTFVKYIKNKIQIKQRARHGVQTDSGQDTVKHIKPGPESNQL